MLKIFTGIGSRVTPTNIQDVMEKIAVDLCGMSWTLRSGGAKGADDAFERGCYTGNKEIYLPWKGFNNHPSTLYQIPSKAYELALEYHPNSLWLKNSKHILKLMARNVQQVLGLFCEIPTDFVVCWTPDEIEHGKDTTRKTGGTGQCLRVASAYNIPIFNLANDDAKDRIFEYIGRF